MNIQMLYNSDNFAVTHSLSNQEEVEKAILSGVRPEVVQLMERHVFEIIDKRSHMQVCLHDGMAENFAELARKWMNEGPVEQQVVEDVLDGYSQIATLSMQVH